MIMHSRRRIRIRGVVADTVAAKLLMPDDTIKLLNAVVIGATTFARVGKHELLPWPPQTIFAEFSQEFLKSQLSLGYARPLSLNGFLNKTHLIRDAKDPIFVTDLRHQQRYVVGQKFAHWLAREHRKHDHTWPQVIKRLNSAIQAYIDGDATFEQLVKQFEKVYHAFGPFQQQRLHDLIIDAQLLSAKFERSLDAQLPVVWLFTAVQQVENFQYGDERENLIKAELNHFEKRNEPGYLQHMFDQVQLQKQQFQALGLPFYDPQWLATMHERERPVWDPDQLKQYL